MLLEDFQQAAKYVLKKHESYVELQYNALKAECIAFQCRL